MSDASSAATPATLSVVDVVLPCLDEAITLPWVLSRMPPGYHPAGPSVSTRSSPAPFAVAVLAKEPRPGRVKTRLCPPYTPEQAARLATAALLDTLDVVAATPAARRLLVLDGDASGWQRPGFQTLRQRGASLDERLANALVDVAEATGLPVLLIGMDTPQLQPRLLLAAARALAAGDAVIGPATDGGFWAIGLNEPRADHCAGVPMSRADTGRLQLERLQQHGLRTTVLSPLTDVDDDRSAAVVASAAPGSRFAQVCLELSEPSA